MGRLVSAADVEAAAERGDTVLVVSPGSLLSPLAQDRAQELGITLADPASAPATARSGANLADDVRDALRTAIARHGDQDLPQLVRSTLQELGPAGPSADQVPAGAGTHPLSGRVAIVTGASSGIGAAIAATVAAAGAKVAIGTFAGDVHDPAATLAEVERVGGEGIIVAADVRDSSQVDALFDEAVSEWGGVDIAVANAAVLSRDPLDSLDDETWAQVLDVDLGGVMRTCRSAAARLGAGGAILAVGSIAGGVFGWSEHSHYAAAKAGILGLVRSLAAELGPDGIRVNAVLPGLIETPQSLDEGASLGADGLAAAAASVPLRRIGLAEEVARAACFLVSDDASYITGQSLVVDGGVSTALSL